MNATIITDYLNNKYIKPSDKIPELEVVELSGNKVALSYWEHGVIAATGRVMYFIKQDDLHWYYEGYTRIGSSCSASLSDALLRIDFYLKAKGKPYYYDGSDITDVRNLAGYEI